MCPSTLRRRRDNFVVRIRPDDLAVLRELAARCEWTMTAALGAAVRKLAMESGLKDLVAPTPAFGAASSNTPNRATVQADPRGVGAQAAFDSAMDLLSLNFAELIDWWRVRGKGTLWRALIVGAMREIPPVQPSFPEIARLLCQTTHTTMVAAYESWNRLPRALQQHWLDMVRANALAQMESHQAPRAAGGPRAGASLPRGSAR